MHYMGQSEKALFRPTAPRVSNLLTFSFVYALCIHYVYYAIVCITHTMTHISHNWRGLTKCFYCVSIDSIIYVCIQNKHSKYIRSLVTTTNKYDSSTCQTTRTLILFIYLSSINYTYIYTPACQVVIKQERRGRLGLSLPLTLYIYTYTTIYISNTYKYTLITLVDQHQHNRFHQPILFHSLLAIVYRYMTNRAMTYFLQVLPYKGTFCIRSLSPCLMNLFSPAPGPSPLIQPMHMCSMLYKGPRFYLQLYFYIGENMTDNCY